MSTPTVNVEEQSVSGDIRTKDGQDHQRQSGSAQRWIAVGRRVDRGGVDDDPGILSRRTVDRVRRASVRGRENAPVNMRAARPLRVLFCSIIPNVDLARLFAYNFSIRFLLRGMSYQRGCDTHSMR